jgi:hypothetical protein
MTVDTWEELIAAHYKLAKDLIFSGSDLVEAVCRTQWLENLIQGGGLVKEDLTLYRNSHRPKGAKRPIHCFLAAGKNEKPTGENAKKIGSIQLRRKSSSSLADAALPEASLTFTYWELPEAQKLFVPKGDETVLEGIEAQIAI